MHALRAKHPALSPTANKSINLSVFVRTTTIWFYCSPHGVPRLLKLGIKELAFNSRILFGDTRACETITILGLSAFDRLDQSTPSAIISILARRMPA